MCLKNLNYILPIPLILFEFNNEMDIACFYILILMYLIFFNIILDIHNVI